MLKFYFVYDAAGELVQTVNMLSLAEVPEGGRVEAEK